MTKIRVGKIVEGTATRWDPVFNRLTVEIQENEFGENALGFVYPGGLSMYEEDSSDLIYSKTVAYCIGIKLRYLVTGLSDEGPILSRKELGKQTLETLLEKPDMRFFGIIRNISSTMMFVDVDGVSGICLAKEAVYAYVKDLRYVFKVGEKIPFKIISYNDSEKLYLSHIDCLKPKAEIIASYPIGTVIQAVVLGKVDPSGDTFQKMSRFILIDKICPGIVDVPEDALVHYGDTITVCIKKHSKKGVRATFIQ